MLYYPGRSTHLSLYVVYVLGPCDYGQFMNEACHITDMHMRAVFFFFRDIADRQRGESHRESARERSTSRE